jgi:hypothetical protein
MMMNANDPRGPKAVAIATDAGQWLKCRTADGRKAYGIPAASEPGRYYLVTRTSCDCYDGRRRTCKHQIAVQLHCELMAEQVAPAPTADLGRILNPKPAAWARPRGVIPASQIERED